MTNLQTDICREYEGRVVNRATSRDNGLLPPLESVDWADQPLKFKIYENTASIPLDLSARNHVSDSKEPKSITYPDLSSLLYFSNGILRRKFEINWNNSTEGPTRHSEANYSRGAASGGGLYPVEIYVAAGPGSPVMPGMYHYDNAHNALQCLANGDAAAIVREACFGHPFAKESSCFLLLSVNFWKNYFKYHEFSYQVVTQDIGAMQAAIQHAGTSSGLDAAFLNWFHDRKLNDALGLDTTSESVFSVVAFPDTCPYIQRGPSLGKAKTAAFQRSRNVFSLPGMEHIHLSTLVDSPPVNTWPLASPAPDTGEERIKLPDTIPPAKTLHEILLSRSSSWGKMRSHPPLPLASMGTLLKRIHAGQQARSDLAASPLTRLMLIANHVADLERGVYGYESETQELRHTNSGDLSLELQEHYFLQNYNLEQSAAVIAVVGSLDESLSAYGNRGLRFLNHEVGRAAQAAYMAAAALSIGCGAALGFNNAELNRLLGLDATETSLLLLFVGNEAGSLPAFDFRLV